MFKKLLPYLYIILLVVGSTIILWLPFLVKTDHWLGLNIPNSDFRYILRNYDGPLYIVPAKTWYNPKLIDNLHLELPLIPQYFAAHLPLYPLLITFFSFLLGYLKSMVFVNVLFAILLTGFIYYISRKWDLTSKPLWLSLVFLFLPRLLVIRSIGAPESLFMFLILLSLVSFEAKKYFLAGIFGGLATMTKTPGILLFAAYFLTILENYYQTKKINIRWLSLLLIPLGLLIVFFIYSLRYGDFFAYFNNGAFVPLVFPFSVFNFQKTWVETAWLEDIVFYFFLYLLTVINLFKSKYRSFYFFSLVFFIATTFVQHRDISRYSLPLWPLTCITFEKFFTSKKFLIAFLILLPAIYLYAWNFITANILPISNWQAFL